MTFFFLGPLPGPFSGHLTGGGGPKNVFFDYLFPVAELAKMFGGVFCGAQLGLPNPYFEGAELTD